MLFGTIFVVWDELPGPKIPNRFGKREVGRDILPPVPL
jgi:hypothetical protein